MPLNAATDVIPDAAHRLAVMLWESRSKLSTTDAPLSVFARLPTFALTSARIAILTPRLILRISLLPHSPTRVVSLLVNSPLVIPSIRRTKNGTTRYRVPVTCWILFSTTAALFRCVQGAVL